MYMQPCGLHRAWSAAETARAAYAVGTGLLYVQYTECGAVFRRPFPASVLKTANRPAPAVSYGQCQDQFFFMHGGLFGARQRLYDVPVAVDVLIGGRYPRLPKGIQYCGGDINPRPMFEVGETFHEQCRQRYRLGCGWVCRLSGHGTKVQSSFLVGIDVCS